MPESARKPLKPGPDPLPQADKRVPRGVPLSPTEVETIRTAADAVGMPLTTFIRTAALHAADATNRSRGTRKVKGAGGVPE